MPANLAGGELVPSTLDSHAIRPGPERDDAVDVLRGLAILGMVLVNHWPPTQDVYPALRHAAFLGWTLADTIFPVFLFLVGIAIALSSRRQGSTGPGSVYGRIIRRTAILFAINLMLVNFPFYDNLVLTGTLSRIAICYFVVAVLAQTCSPRMMFGIATALLVLQWAVLMFLPVPGYGAGLFTQAGNSSVFIDQLVFGEAVQRLMLTGTLSRIAICYFVVAVLAQTCSPRMMFGIATALLVLQWAVLMFLPVPGYGAGLFTEAGNSSVYIDQLVFGEAVNRLMLNGPVSQGILPHVGSIASTIVGVLAGTWLVQRGTPRSSVLALIGVGFALLIAGSAWGRVYPISKPLWTGSYVVMMSGLSILLLVLINGLLQLRGMAVLLKPLRVAGLNALFFYLLAQSMQRVLVYYRFEDAAGNRVQLREFLFEMAFEPINSGPFGALLYALVFVAVCYLPVHLLYRNRTFIRL